MSGGTVVVQIGCSLKTNRDQKFSLENKNQSNQTLSRITSRKLDDRIPIKTRTYHPRVSESAFAVAKGGGESGGAGLVIPGRLAVVGG